MVEELYNLEKRLGTVDDVPTNNQAQISWVRGMRDMCKLANVHWGTGSDEECVELCELMVKGGTFILLNLKKRPHISSADHALRTLPVLGSSSLSVSAWLTMRPSLYEAQIGFGAGLVSTSPPPPRAPR